MKMLSQKGNIDLKQLLSPHYFEQQQQQRYEKQKKCLRFFFGQTVFSDTSHTPQNCPNVSASCTTGLDVWKWRESIFVRFLSIAETMNFMWHRYQENKLSRFENVTKIFWNSSNWVKINLLQNFIVFSEEMKGITPSVCKYCERLHHLPSRTSNSLKSQQFRSKKCKKRHFLGDIGA
jgi:hypothetical protein